MKPSIARKIVKYRQEFLRARKKRTPKLQLLRTIAFSPHPATAVQPKYAPGTPREKRRSPEFPPATPKRTSLRPNTRNLTSNGEACSCKEVLKKVESLMIHTHSLCHTHTHTHTYTHTHSNVSYMELKRRHEELASEVQTLGQQSKKAENQHQAKVNSLAEEIRHYKVLNCLQCLHSFTGYTFARRKVW